ncbi:uncharacterized protein [Dermacentor andersoni]|uniref:uncharacterized protein n=1 Tax=Dermacentor andersoni TaxID=34620 RepID=UPI003B3B4DA2
MDENSIEYLTEFVNQAWSSGKVPGMWKRGTTILIGMPEKPPNLATRKPISFTLCVGKVAEYTIRNRDSRYMEDKNVYPDNMIGLRAAVSTQDAIWLIKDQVINTRGTRTILYLDLEKVFDNILHFFVLGTFSSLRLGEPFHD